MKQPITLRPGNSLFRLCDGNGQDLGGKDFRNDPGERNARIVHHPTTTPSQPAHLSHLGSVEDVFWPTSEPGHIWMFAHQLPGGFKEGNNVSERLAQYHRPRQPRNALWEAARKSSGRSRTLRNGAMLLWLAVANAAELTNFLRFFGPPASALRRGYRGSGIGPAPARISGVARPSWILLQLHPNQATSSVSSSVVGCLRFAFRTASWFNTHTEFVVAVPIEVASTKEGRYEKTKRSRFELLSSPPCKSTRLQ